MFEAAELGRKVPKKIFAAEEPKLHTRLLRAQRALVEAKLPVIVIVSGVEGAGKGDVVSLLNRWLDPRGIQTHAYWSETDEEAERPRYWRFWRSLPPAGSTGILFGSWYTEPIIDHVFGRCSKSAFDRELSRIREFERLLTDGGALIVKFWFHMSKSAQRDRLESDAKKSRRNSPLLKKFSKKYERFAAVSERTLRATDTGNSRWHLIEATDRRYRDLSVGKILLHAIERRLESGRAATDARLPESPEPAVPEASVTILDRVDLHATLDEADYGRRLRRNQRALFDLAWKALKRKIFTVAVFEGWDAAGKGGVIRRVTQAVDARLYRVISIAAPTDEEKAQHYQWRFWRHLPRAGRMTLYDRSWYGRVLVERVERFASEDEWVRSYREINDFEEQLSEHGVVLLKFWLHISPEEQLKRFREREKTPWKQHKLTDEDWRNREKWDAYAEAVNDMIARTSTTHAPWTLVPANDKRFARVHVLETFRRRLQAALD